MKRKLFRTLFNRDVWEQYGHKLNETFFPEELRSLYRTLKYIHGKHQADVQLDELREVHFAINPTTTESAKVVVNETLSKLEESEVDFSSPVIEEIVNAAWREELCTRIMDQACKIAEGKSEDWDIISDLVDTSKKDLYSSESYDIITLDDMLDVFSENAAEDRWLFNLPNLQEATGGLPRTSFGVAAARPEVGKTAFWVSLCCSPGGFVHQGAKIHIWRNEETFTMVGRRVISSMLGVPQEEALSKREEYKELVAGLDGGITLLKDDDTAGADIANLEQYIVDNEGELDILIIDQIDNLYVDNKPCADDPVLLGRLYSKARELSNKYGISILAVTQAGAGAEGKRYYGYNELYGSKTNKAAMGDYVFCIGADRPNSNEVDNGARYLNFAKNKLKGPHPPIIYVLDHKTSTMRE